MLVVKLVSSIFWQNGPRSVLAQNPINDVIKKHPKTCKIMFLFYSMDLLTERLLNNI